MAPVLSEEKYEDVLPLSHPVLFEELQQTTVSTVDPDTQRLEGTIPRPGTQVLHLVHDKAPVSKTLISTRG
jgi:hypothetical protein